jgi:hypothetical protein
VAKAVGDEPRGHWCELELDGYPEGKEVPAYRKVLPELMATVRDGYDMPAYICDPAKT